MLYNPILPNLTPTSPPSIQFNTTNFPSLLNINLHRSTVPNGKHYPSSKTTQWRPASPLFLAGHSQVISRISKGSQHIDAYEKLFISSDVSNAFYCIKAQSKLNSNQKMHCRQTYKRLLIHAVKLGPYIESQEY